ncbi:MAG TPA: hypothetical protein VJ860_06760 [Polyangia bacterium]|nr:hypothetical protein [Polyangia bacterium]
MATGICSDFLMNLKSGIVVLSYHRAVADRHENRSTCLFHRRPWSRKLVRIFAGGVPSTAMRGRGMVSQLNTASLGILAVLAMSVVLLGFAPGAAAAGLDKKSTADAKQATQLYKTGNYEEAAKIFLQLSIDNPSMPVAPATSCQPADVRPDRSAMPLPSP